MGDDARSSTRERRESREQLTPKERNEPEDQREGGAEHRTSHDREIKRSVAALVDDVAREASESKRQPGAKQQGASRDHQDGAEGEKEFAKFAEGVHMREGTAERKEVKLGFYYGQLYDTLRLPLH